MQTFLLLIQYCHFSGDLSNTGSRYISGHETSPVNYSGTDIKTVTELY